VNAIIQGSAAEIIKLAMLRLYEKGSMPIMQVHDELMFEIPKYLDLPVIKDIIAHTMRTVVNLSVPLEVNGGYGDNWANAK
jgi:DNA polymerase-1